MSGGKWLHIYFNNSFQSSRIAKPDQIFQYRNPPSQQDERPPPPSYQSAVNSTRRLLPGQAKRGKLVASQGCSYANPNIV